MDWSPTLAKVQPLASLVVRPALTSLQLSLHQRDNPRRSSPARLGHLKRLSDWCALDQLVRADLSGAMYPARFFLESVVACLPDTLEELVLSQNDDGDMGPVLKHVEHFKGLKVLEIYPGDIRTKGRFNPLELFPALHRLAFAHPIPAFILETGHPALETLILGQPPPVPNETYGLDELDLLETGFAYMVYDAVRPALDRLCALVKADAGAGGTARFPRARGRPAARRQPAPAAHLVRAGPAPPGRGRARGCVEAARGRPDVPRRGGPQVGGRVVPPRRLARAEDRRQGLVDDLRKHDGRRVD